jgi:hypothetical protein
MIEDFKSSGLLDAATRRYRVIVPVPTIGLLRATKLANCTERFLAMY